MAVLFIHPDTAVLVDKYTKKFKQNKPILRICSNSMCYCMLTYNIKLDLYGKMCFNWRQHQWWTRNEIIVDAESWLWRIKFSAPTRNWTCNLLITSTALPLIEEWCRQKGTWMQHWSVAKINCITLFRWPWPSVWVSVAPQRCRIQGHAHRLHGSGCGSAERGHQLGAQLSWFTPHYHVRLEPFRSVDFRILSAAHQLDLVGGVGGLH